MDDHLPYNQRFAHGRVISLFTNSLDVALAQPLDGVSVVRVLREHWPDEGTAWAVGDPVHSLFVYDVGAARSHPGEHSNSDHAFASILWGQPARNPWNSAHPAHPVVGQVVEGMVYQRAGERNVVVRVGDHLLEGFLNLSQVPHGRGSAIEQLLPLQMRLRATVTEVNTGRCKIELSVVEWLKMLERQRGRGPHDIGKAHDATPYLRFAEAGQAAPAHRPAALSGTLGDATLSTRWQGCRVLLIDNDKIYPQVAQAWLTQFGAEFLFADNVVHAKQLLASNDAPPTHVLVDYHFGSSRDVIELVRMLGGQRKRTHIAVISGLLGQDVVEGVRGLRERLKFPSLGLFAKPMRFEPLDAWLTRNALPDLDPHPVDPAEHWHHDAGLVSTDLAQRAVQWLHAVAEQTKVAGVLWVRCHGPGHDLVAGWGLLQDQPPDERAAALAALNHQLAHTVVADVEATGSPHARTKATAGPLIKVFPRSASHCLALPLSELASGVLPVKEVTDVLLLFAPSALTASYVQKLGAWQALWHWWRDLLELERLQDRLQEDAVFATQGRVHMATLHELRPPLQVFQSREPWTADIAQAWWPLGQKVSALVEGCLYTIRPERVQEVSLRERLYAVMDQFLWPFAQRRFVTVVMHLPPEGLRLALAPEVLEQPLINLVDNATKACAQRRWAQVHVHVRVEPNDVEHPLVLSISDDGVGMTPQEARHLYQPRHSQLGKGGFGMGLFVSQRLARAAGGALKLVENLRWGGCTFELRLPLVMGRASLVNKTEGTS